ncbi:MAG: HAD hydrolase-like protein [Verrucomicrobiota bacterium]|nr:HAD hydrolase-like protein [Verrucomicrobiota bacterium]
MSQADKLLLFDIDGTLVDTEGAGLRSLEEGFFKAFPHCRGKDFPALDLGGATDSSVVAFLFEHFEIDDHDGHRELFFSRYIIALDGCMNNFRNRGKGRVLPGVPELLGEFERREDCLMGLLTGNIEAGARLKLRYFGIDHHFCFGAYGNDHSLRNELGPIAIDRAEGMSGQRFAPQQTVIIGDTLKDIACARAFGAHVIAVATGGASYEQLESGEPDILLADLAKTDEMASAIDLLFSS